jgi:hypothetical protein
VSIKMLMLGMVLGMMLGMMLSEHPGGPMGT